METGRRGEAAPRATSRGRWSSGPWIAVCLAGSAIAIALAPLLMPDPYSWLTHTTSESAAQGVDGAWLARLGFLLFGLAVMWQAAISTSRWGLPGKMLHGGFGVLMIAAAAFSHRPFAPGAAYDRVEDLLHSIAATGMGLLFAIGVLVVGLRRGPAPFPSRLLDVTAVVASVLIPISMVSSTAYAGILQRTMFLIAYLWYAAEALDRAHTETAG